jgi:uncharacterized protein YbjT (DUF2867 family)
MCREELEGVKVGWRYGGWCVMIHMPPGHCFTAPTVPLPALQHCAVSVVLLAVTTGVERNAIIGDDAAARKRDIPIVQLNPGGVLNYKYDAECTLRASGLPYTVIRCAGVFSAAAVPAVAAHGLCKQCNVAP